MTAIVGVLCSDGVVIGTDSSSTFTTGQVSTIEQPMEKLDIIGERIIVAGTGAVGLGQRFCAIVRRGWDNREFQKPEIEIGKSFSAQMIQDMGSTAMRPGMYGALIAFPSAHKAHLCEFDLPHFQPELKTRRLWYVSMGSSQLITDPFLGLMREVFWGDGPPKVQEAVFAVTWALDHAVAVNPGGVNAPVRIATLETQGQGNFSAKILAPEELDEHRQNIEEAKNKLRDFRRNHQGRGNLTPPDLPVPPAARPA